MAGLWDQEGIADLVESTWRNSPDEMQRRHDLAKMVRRYMSTDQDTILEVGCGTGLVYASLREEIGGRLHYTGLDSSRRMLDIARQRHVTARFLEGDAFKLTFPDREFDMAVSFEVFGHMEDPTKAIQELVRVARRRAIFSFWPSQSARVIGPRDHLDHYQHPPELIDEILKAIVRWKQTEHVKLGPTAIRVVLK